MDGGVLDNGPFDFCIDLIAEKRADRPTARELVYIEPDLDSTVVLFTLGGVFSIFEGVEKIVHPHAVEDVWIAVVVLIGAAILEGLSFRTARAEANLVRPKE